MKKNQSNLGHPYPTFFQLDQNSTLMFDKLHLIYKHSMPSSQSGPATCQCEMAATYTSLLHLSLDCSHWFLSMAL